jgi:ubiquinone/menaquinone biosynthesis C-methylase UbiE
MKSSQIRVLDKSQVESFDTEYVNEEMWSTLQMILNERETIIGSSFSFLDIGGGNGKFTDRILSVFSESHGCLADNSSYLLSLNASNPRKTVIEVNVEEIKTLFPEQKFDIIFMNWVLHHFVKGGYRTTMRTQVDILTQAKDLLSKNGRIIVIENLPDGLFGETVCSFIINRVTSSKIFAPIVKKMGGNTAGVGICFLGERQWSKQFLLAGLHIEKITKFAKWSLNPIKKVALTIKSIRAGIFVVSAKL